MATTFKTFLNNDIVSTRTLLHEAIPITGAIVSGTYADANVKNYAHGMFQSVYDYPYLSSSANHIFDITCGYAPHSAVSTNTQNQKKMNIYNQMGQVLVGHDVTGGIQQFDRDGNLIAGGDKIEQACFINFSRLLVKDEIKKGSFSISFHTGGANTAPTDDLTLYDTDAESDYRVNSPAGEYAVLYTSSVGGSSTSAGNVESGTGLGLLFYQAGIAVISSSVFPGQATAGNDNTATDYFGATSQPKGNAFIALTASTVQNFADGIRNRLRNIQFNNTTELNSTIYFCRINHNEFNYSSNPTYLTGSKLRVKNSSDDSPVTYITTIGLYSSDNELLAAAKLSEPLKKDPSTELVLRVRLDY
jgi:hypothetical protein